MLSRLFRRRFLEELAAAHGRGQLRFFGEHADLADPDAFAQWLTPLRPGGVGTCTPSARSPAPRACWYFSRYTHRVAISNRRLLAFDQARRATLPAEGCRAERRPASKTIRLSSAEFMRRFLLHVLPGGFHRIRHYGLLANARRKSNLATARTLLHQPAPTVAIRSSEAPTGTGHAQPTFRCRHCGAPMLVLETFARVPHIRGPPVSAARS